MHVAVGVLSFRNQQHKNRGRGHHESDEQQQQDLDGWGGGVRCDAASRGGCPGPGPGGCPGVVEEGDRGGGGVEGWVAERAPSSSGTPTRSSADRRRLLGVSVWWE